MSASRPACARWIAGRPKRCFEGRQLGVADAAGADDPAQAFVATFSAASRAKTRLTAASAGRVEAPVGLRVAACPSASSAARRARLPAPSA